MNQLFSDDEEPTTTTQLTINEHYAKAFEYRKEREELERLKAKYGSDYDPDGSGSEFSTDSESAESEDEHGEELTPAVDAAILRTLARIRKKDPEIYNSEKNIFGEEKEKVGSGAAITQKKSKDKSKPVTLRQVNMEAMLNSSRESSPDDEPRPLTHVQEQEALRKETIAAFHKAAEQVDEDDLLVPREKTKDEREREEEEYRAFLEREVGDLAELVTIEDHAQGDDASVAKEDEDEGHNEGESKEKKKKKKKSKKVSDESTTSTKKTKAEEDQEFLLNYILNRGWIDKSHGHVPTYNEVTSPNKERRRKKEKSKPHPSEGEGNNSDGSNSGAKDEDEENDPGLLSDASFESLASYFETSYNHRFEEPGAAIIPSFPRNLPSAVRREDTTRKEARERRKERKEQELQKKREEVKRLKALKMREVKRKLELIGKQAGLKKTAGKGDDWEGEDDDFVDEALRELDLEGEWDPEKHDRQMAGLFDRGAEAFEDEGGEELSDDGARYDENGKPIWDDDVDIGDIPISDDDANIVFDKSPKLTKKEKKKKKKKDESFNDNDGVDVDAMDADVAPQYNPDEEWDGTEEMRKRKFNEYMDEIYGLDFNDLVGDLPTRFKYVPVQPQNYALTPAEILMATDQELNEYMSVKKYAPYRQDKRDANRWNPKTREKLHEIKSKVNERLGTSSFASGSAGHPRGEGTHGEKPKKRMGKKERMKQKAALGDAEGDTPAAVSGTADAGDEPSRDSKGGETLRSPKNKKRKREIPNHEVADQNEATSKEARHLDGGESGSKKKRKRRHRPADETVQS